MNTDQPSGGRDAHAKRKHTHKNTLAGGRLVPSEALAADGTPSTTTFLRGDNTWAEPPASGTGADGADGAAGADGLGGLTFAHQDFTASTPPKSYYELTYQPVNSSVLVGLNGHVQVEDTDYTVNNSTGVITFAVTPSAGDVVVARYVTNSALASGRPALVSDDFNRPDSLVSLGTTSDGLYVWNVTQGTGGIDSSSTAPPAPPARPRGYFPALSAGFAFAVVDVGTTDVDASIEVDGQSAAQGLLYRYSNTSNYWAALGDGLYKVVAGAFTNMVPHVYVANVGLTIRVTSVGNTLSYFVNGTLVGSVTDSFNNTATKFGLYAQSTADRFDNLNIVA